MKKKVGASRFRQLRVESDQPTLSLALQWISLLQSSRQETFWTPGFESTQKPIILSDASQSTSSEYSSHIIALNWCYTIIILFYYNNKLITLLQCKMNKKNKFIQKWI